jgi:hypothetical protein
MTCSRYAVVALALLAAACGGAVNGGGDGAGGTANVAGSGGAVNVGGAGNGAGGTGGTTGIGGDAAATCSAPAPPSIVFEKACAAFVPALMPYEVTFVERTSIDVAGSRMMAHRFRTTSSTNCGFDVVISLPGLAFAADAAPYELSVWWIQGSVPLGMLAVVLRRAGNRAVLLSVASAGSVWNMNNLLTPLAVTLDGPACAIPGGQKNRQVVERDGAPLACADEAGGLRLCNDGTATYRMVDYPGQPAADDVPAIFGAGDLLTVAP